MSSNYQIKNVIWGLIASIVFSLTGCQQIGDLAKPTVRPVSLRDVPAQKLSFRFEPDVLAPSAAENIVASPAPEKLTAIQADFDQNRPQDALARTIISLDKQRVAAVYQTAADEKDEFRLDLYETTGRFIRHVTPENLSAVFPDAIAWSPNGENLAFIASRRLNSPVNQEIVQAAPRPPDLDETQNSNLLPETSISPALTPAIIPAFATEQIYLCNREGGELAALTKNENTIYFDFKWSPDSTMFAALSLKEREWRVLEERAQKAGEVFRPVGRLYLIEKNGGERRLEDIPTAVAPVWSPDSAKIATAFDKSVRIYDALGESPTAAAIQLQTSLLLSSKACDEKLAANQSCVNATAVAPIDQNNSAPTSEPVTFLPIVALSWPEDKTLYLETGFFKDYLDGKSFRSYARWHRLNFSPQAAVLN